MWSLAITCVIELINFQIRNQSELKQKKIKSATNIFLKANVSRYALKRHIFRLSQMKFEACQAFCKATNKGHKMQHS